MKRLALLSLLTITLSSCAQRTKQNCERVRDNKMPTTVGTDVRIGGGRCA